MQKLNFFAICPFTFNIPFLQCDAIMITPYDVYATHERIPMMCMRNDTACAKNGVPACTLTRRRQERKRQLQVSEALSLEVIVTGERVCRLLPLSGAQLLLRTCSLSASVYTTSTDGAVDSVRCITER